MKFISELEDDTDDNEEEDAPLLIRSIHNSSIEGSYDPPFAWRSKVFREELKSNFKMAFPVLLTNVMQYMVNVETMAFCGRLTETELEGVGFAISLISAFGWYVCTGMSTACDTMFAQAFGSKNKMRTGVFLQRGLLLLNLVPLVLWTFHFNFEPILIALGQDPHISRVTGEFVIAFSPGILFMINYVILARYMQDQGCLYPPLIAGICGNVFNILSQLLFVTYLGYGSKAAALCHGFSFAVMVLAEIIYIIKSKFYVPTWPGFQLEAFYDWSHMFKLGIAGVGHLTFEVLVWEITIFLAGLLGPIQLATQSVLIQIATITSMMFYGFGLVCNIRVGQCLGANLPNHAKVAYRAGIVNEVVCLIILATILVSLRYQIPFVFTDKQEAINMINDNFLAILPIIFIDSFSGLCSATLRGCGRQAMGGLIIFISLYCIALPMGCVLSFVYNLNVIGFWIGNTTGAFIGLVSVFLILECQNWNMQAFLAQNRIMKGSIKANDVPTHSSNNAGGLPRLLMDEDYVNKAISHIRTPSHPVTCSIDVVHLPKPRVGVHKSIIFKKLMIVMSVVIFFLIGLSIHLFLPTDLYRPFNTSVKSN